MVAVGCLFLIVFPIIGVMVGLFGFGDGTAAIWGAAIGFVLALAFFAVMGGALVKAGRRR